MTWNLFITFFCVFLYWIWMYFSKTKLCWNWKVALIRYHLNIWISLICVNYLQFWNPISLFVLICDHINLLFRIKGLSWWRTLSYRNQSIDLRSKSMDWFVYDDSLPHERVKTLWSNDQAYWQLCHSTLFSHIQGYSEPCANLIYAETEDT